MTKITNTSEGIRTVNATVNSKATQVSLKPGETKELDVIVSKGFEARVAGGQFKVSKTKPDETGLKAEHHGGGKFNVTKGEETLLSGLSKADADTFNAMSEGDKAAYVEASKS